MPTTCPRCGSSLSDPEGLCRHCGWSAPYLVRRRQPPKPAGSFSDRYRGTIYDTRVSFEAVREPGMGRGRLLVALGAIGVASLFAMILVAGPPA